MGHHRTHKSAFLTTVAAAAVGLMMAASDGIALEAREIGPGIGGPGAPSGLAGKGDGLWAKSGSTLRRIFGANHAHQQAGRAAPFKPDNPAVRVARGRILIDAFAANGDGAALLADLQGLGLENGAVFRHVVSGYMPLNLLDKAVELGSLRAISASLKPETNSSIDPTFGLVHDRSAARAMGLIATEVDPQTYTGAGVKVGVLSDTYDFNSLPDYDGDGFPDFPATNATDDIANGDLPGGGPFVALHTPGNDDFDDKSAFAAVGANGSNTTIDNTQFALDRDAPDPDGSIRFNPVSFSENPVTGIVSYPDANHYTIGSKPFTIEMWVRFETTFTNGLGPNLASHYSLTGDDRGWFLGLRGPNDSSPNSLGFWASLDGTTNAVFLTWPWLPATNRWYHIAISRDETSSVRAFIDGQRIGNIETMTESIFDSSADLRISSYDRRPGEDRPLDGWIEDFRMVVGEAMYTSNFTPPGPLASELPTLVATTNVVAEGNDPGIDEGRAMMQLIHDVAPDASLSFHSAFNGLADFALGIVDLAADGADVIVDDIIYFAEPMFQDGIIAQAVDTVVSQGIPYFSSAGNSARKSYESPFVASDERLEVVPFPGFPAEERGMLHDFDPGPGVDWRQSVTIPVGTSFTLVTQWDQPFASTCGGCPGSTNDVDIYLVDDADQIITSSISDNLTTGEPVEILQLVNSGQFGTESFHIMMTHYDVVTGTHPQPGSPPTLMKNVWFASSSVTVNEYNTNSAASYGHANADGAAAVGAAYYLDTPAYGQTPPLLESFSSAGGTPILFDISGNALGVPELREKPEFVAPDGTNTTFFYRDTSTDDADEAPETFPNFFGTSAAAPHAAAIAALMLEANPALSPADIYTALENTAVEMGLAGFDNDTGYGLIDANAALAQVTGGNLVPVAQNDIANTFENTLVSIPVLANDALGDTPTAITNVTDPLHGTAVKNGTVIDYTPDTDYDGPDSFDYTIADNDGETSSATVNVTVTVQDVLPSAVDDVATTDEDIPAVGLTLMSNDDQGNAPATITSAGPISTEGGTVSISPDGTTVTYNPPLNYSGLSDTFPYTITDNDGDDASAMVTMTVNAVNDAPVFDSDSYVKANGTAGEPYTGETLAGTASDLESNGLSYSITNGPAWLTITPDGALGGTPINPDNVGVNPFTVTVTDDGTPAESDTATLFITVDAPAGNNLPTANGETVAPVLEDSGLANHAVLGNDSFGGDGPSNVAIALGAATGGIASVNTGGTANDPTDDSIDFTPAANFNGNATVGYTIQDSNGDQASATLTIPVTPVNDLPTAGNDLAAAVDQDTVSANYTVLGNDSFGGDGPSNVPVALGTITGGVALVNEGGSANDPTDDTIDFTPAGGFSGTATVAYTIQDSNGDTAQATLSIPVNPVVTTVVHIGAMSASSTPAPRGRWDAGVTFTTHLADHSPISGTLIEGVWSNGANGGASCTTDGGGQCSVSKANLKGNVASVDFTVTNVSPASGTYDSGANDTGTSITVLQTGNPTNLLPNAVNDSNTTSVDTPVNGNVLSNDDQGDAPATVTSFDAVGTLLGGGVTIDASGNYIYTPPSGVDGVDTFGYTITDNNGDTANATVTITINPDGGNLLPNAVNDTNSTSVDVQANGNVLSNDNQGDAPATVTSFDAVGVPLGGGLIVAGNGVYTYTPPAGLVGSDVFNYTITDNNGDTSNATLTVTVNPVAGGVTINSATAYKDKGLQKVDLTWSGAATAVDIYRDGVVVIADTANDGAETDHIDVKGAGSYEYLICETGGGACSSTVNVVF